MELSEAQILLDREAARAELHGWSLAVRESGDVNGVAHVGRKLVVVTRGALDLDEALVAAIVAHEIGHARQRFRWLFLIAPALALGASWQLGVSWPVAPIAAAILIAYQAYEVDADAWASAAVGAAPVEALLRLAGERWRAVLVARRARKASGADIGDLPASGGISQ